jgi:3-hydroxyisobutyrate dehydrogenase-like beta-hydroxyacid dehydrogenase
MKPSVGFIGLGLMGQPMAANVLRAGFSLTVWNRTPVKAEKLVAEGARFGASPRDVAANSDVLVTIVSDPAALEEVLWGAKGALEGLRADSVLVDSSTVSPALARRVSEACYGRKVGFLDAPVTGGTWGAEKGELVFMTGGPAEVVERTRPVLSVMGKRIFHLGPNGAGQTVKLAMNLLLALEVQAFAEALALVTAAGLSAQDLVEVMQSSMGRAPLLDVKAPLMIEGKFAPSFPLRLMNKDLGLAMNLAREQKTDLPAGTACRSTYSAVNAAATEDVDYCAVAQYWRKEDRKGT